MTGTDVAPAAVRRRAPVLVAATVTATWAALVSWIPVVAAVSLAAGHLETRVGTGAWLLGHGVPLGRFGLVPLGLAVLAAWRGGRAGGHTQRAVRGRPVPAAPPAPRGGGAGHRAVRARAA